jgi:hypothetical protein
LPPNFFDWQQIYTGHCHDVYEETNHATKEDRKKLIRVMSEKIQIQAIDDEEEQVQQKSSEDQA